MMCMLESRHNIWVNDWIEWMNTLENKDTYTALSRHSIQEGHQFYFETGRILATQVSQINLGDSLKNGANQNFSIGGNQI